MSYNVDKFIVDDNISPRTVTTETKTKMGVNNYNKNKYILGDLDDDTITGEIDDGDEEYDADDVEIMSEEGRIEYIL